MPLTENQKLAFLLFDQSFGAFIPVRGASTNICLDANFQARLNVLPEEVNKLFVEWCEASGVAYFELDVPSAMFTITRK